MRWRLGDPFAVCSPSAFNRDARPSSANSEGLSKRASSVVDSSPKRAMFYDYFDLSKANISKECEHAHESGFELSLFAIFAGPINSEFTGSYSFPPSPSARVGKP